MSLQTGTNQNITPRDVYTPALEKINEGICMNAFNNFISHSPIAQDLDHGQKIALYLEHIKSQR